MSTLSGWGRYPVARCPVLEPRDTGELLDEIARLPSHAIARGNGRSYGDSSLSESCTIDTRSLDRFLAFDADSGTLTCEGGTLLSDIVDLFVPRGWFPAVTPGTQLVTVGGMIASDVHGKNHHVAGSFCEHVTWIDLAIGNGRVLRCSRTENEELFTATCGGMGLTGVIVRAAFRLIVIDTWRIEQTTVRAACLEAAIDLFEASQHATYSAAWVDCLATGAKLGRSAVFLGEHAPVARLPAAERSRPLARQPRRVRRVPVDAPAALLNRHTVRLFNKAYYASQVDGVRIVDLDDHFFPLDALQDWNRMYGRGGFVQYQCVLPLASSRGGLVALLTKISGSGLGSFLAVLKRMGPASFGYLSFPMEGYTLALDFPATPDAMRLLDELDAIVLAHGGRVYLAKDARASARTVASGYPKLEAFREIRRRYDLTRRFSSLQSQRLEL